MIETVAGDLYDYPRYYDLVYGSDWKAEFDFLIAAFQKHATRRVQRVFEPACGTGRLLVKLAQAGFVVSGLDLNERAVQYCNRRLEKKGFPPTARVGDMTAFRLPRKVDAAFNMINSFRHLETGAAAQSHLQHVAESLNKGGLYVLGLHLTPTEGAPLEEESWSARRGNLAVIAHLKTVGLDLVRRRERVAMNYDVYTPKRQFRLTGEIAFRTYTARQINRLLAGVPALELAAIYDFAYRIDCPVRITASTEDTVFVLRKR